MVPGFSMALVTADLGDLVELGPDEPGLGGVGLQQLLKVPADRLAFAVRVGCEEDPVGFLRELHELGDGAFLPRHDLVVGGVVVVTVDRDALLLQVPHVPKAGRDMEVLAEELAKGRGLGGGFDDDEGSRHECLRRCHACQAPSKLILRREGSLKAGKSFVLR